MKYEIRLVWYLFLCVRCCCWWFYADYGLTSNCVLHSRYSVGFADERLRRQTNCYGTNNCAHFLYGLRKALDLMRIWALWLISSIGLSRTIRESTNLEQNISHLAACMRDILCLFTRYFFFFNISPQNESG